MGDVAAVRAGGVTDTAGVATAGVRAVTSCAAWLVGAVFVGENAGADATRAAGTGAAPPRTSTDAVGAFEAEGAAAAVAGASTGGVRADGAAATVVSFAEP